MMLPAWFNSPVVSIFPISFRVQRDDVNHGSTDPNGSRMDQQYDVLEPQQGISDFHSLPTEDRRCGFVGSRKSSRNPDHTNFIVACRP
ncbi:hypothetical protein Bca52824_047739 [Brassica carinata]|uniref:Uncharacterized protein n=1 Tax=Brassica carinata TaxID=52824 RepID=A0A8X7UQ88_BRACI|nr:hypothetical protein Bca52824_047739 [Brassica carinata]